MAVNRSLGQSTRRTRTPLTQAGGRSVPGTGVNAGRAGGPIKKRKRPPGRKKSPGVVQRWHVASINDAQEARSYRPPSRSGPAQGRGASPRSRTTKGKSPVSMGGRSMAASGIHKARRGAASEMNSVRRVAGGKRR